MSSSNLFHDLFSSYELESQDPWQVPTPGVFDLTDSESALPETNATPNTGHHETPETSTPCLRNRPRPEKLTLLQLAEWDRDRTYDEIPPTCLCLTIGWKVTLNGKPITRDTEQDVVLTLPSYWELFLQPKLEKVVGKKRRQKKNMTLEDTNVAVSVTERSEPDLIKQYEGTDIDWSTIERQLVKWGELFRAGKKLRVDLSFNYDGAGQQSAAGSLKKVDKRSARSATQRMRAELDAQLEAEQEASGQPSVWPKVYQLMHCQVSSCNSGNYCWVDPVGKKHYKLNSPLLRKLIKYAQDGNTLDTHSDVPEDIRQEIRLEDQQRFDRKRKARAISPQSLVPINITNVLPGHSERAPLPPPHINTRPSIPAPNTVSALDIPGYRDDAVKDYIQYLQGKVRSKPHKEQFEKAGNIVLDDFLDLDQVYQEQNPEFFTAREVELAPAIQFIKDIPAFVKHRQLDTN
jgi:hypothetical protein